MKDQSGESFGAFPLWSSALVILVVLAALFLPGLPEHWRHASAFGVLVSGATSISGYLILRRAARASNGTFLKLLLGGLVGRLFAALAAVAAGIVWLDLAPTPLATACLGAYAVLSVFEYRTLLCTLTGQA